MIGRRIGSGFHGPVAPGSPDIGHDQGQVVVQRPAPSDRRPVLDRGQHQAGEIIRGPGIALL